MRPPPGTGAGPVQYSEGKTARLPYTHLSNKAMDSPAEPARAGGHQRSKPDGRDLTRSAGHSSRARAVRRDAKSSDRAVSRESELIL